MIQYNTRSIITVNSKVIVEGKREELGNILLVGGDYSQSEVLKTQNRTV
jgi:hypothetical protein